MIVERQSTPTFLQMIIKAANRIHVFNSDKICRSYSDLNFGVTFVERSVQYNNKKSATAKSTAHPSCLVGVLL